MVHQVPFEMGTCPSGESHELISREVLILASMHHPHIVSLIGITQSPRGFLCIVTELCDTGTQQFLEYAAAHGHTPHHSSKLR